MIHFVPGGVNTIRIGQAQRDVVGCVAQEIQLSGMSAGAEELLHNGDGNPQGDGLRQDADGRDGLQWQMHP